MSDVRSNDDARPVTTNDTPRSVAFNIGSPIRRDVLEMEPLLLNNESHLNGTLVEQQQYENEEPRAASDGLVIELFSLEHKNHSDQFVEQARWIKYEEDVEGHDHHWGKPHLPCLFFDNIRALKYIVPKAIMITGVKVTCIDELILIVEEKLKLEHPELAEKFKDLMIVAKARPFNPKSVGRSSTTIGFNRQLTSPTLSGSRGMPSNGNSYLRQFSRSQPRLNTAIDFTKFLNEEEFEADEAAQVFTAECPELGKASLLFVRLSEPVIFPEEGDIPIRFFLIMIGPQSAIGYREMGRSLCTMLADKNFKAIAYTATNGAELLNGLQNFLEASVVLPPTEVDSRKLIQVDDIRKFINNRNKMKKEMEENRVRALTADTLNAMKQKKQEEMRYSCFNGLCEDFTQRVKHYKSDFTDAWNKKFFSAILFMFLACITPAVTFGGLMGQYTNGAMGMTETLFSQCLCGVIWALFAAQPLIVVSSTGPVLIFEGALYTVCSSRGLDFLTVRLYAGIVIFLISLFVVAMDGQRLTRFVTPFTEDIFAVLISVIFITESGKFLFNTFKEYPVEDSYYYQNKIAACLNNSLINGTENENETEIRRLCLESTHPNTSLLTALILVSTFVIACVMRSIRQSKWFGRTFRNIVGDFGVLIALVVVFVITNLLFGDVNLEKLEMPEVVTFTNAKARGHGLIIIPKDYEPISMILASVGAALVFILLFVETEITEVLLCRKDRKLVKGSGKAWDLLLMGFLSLLCSVFGIPWMCAAAVQSLAHCSSLTVNKKRAPGERDECVSVVEQRVTTLVLSLMIGAFVFLGSWLRVPTAILFGVFVYLGCMNLVGVSLVERSKLLFLPYKHYPNTHYVQVVSRRKIQIYTCLGVILVVLVFLVKYFQDTAVLFPFVLLTYVAIRHFVLPYFYNEMELAALDPEEGHEEPCEVNDGVHDFYGQAPIPV